MPPIGELTILVPIDISDTEPPPLEILDVLRPFEVILLGYFPVPDQAEPALIKHEYGDDAEARLERIATDRRDVTPVLVFTHDREATIDRVADQHDCDVILTAGDTDHIDRILVPVRGDANVERIVSIVAGLLRGSDATATLLHTTGDGDDPSQGEFLLRGAIDRFTEYGVDADRLDWVVAEDGDPVHEIVTRGADYDVVVLGETEPSLRERIIGDVLSRILDGLAIPALVVRDVE